MAKVRGVAMCCTLYSGVFTHSINPLVFSEVAGFGVLLILEFSIAVVASTGRAYTCDHVATNGKFDE